MTALSDLLVDAKNEGRNVDHWVDQAEKAGHKINRATVYKYLDGDHAKSPTERTLKALAFVFDLDVRDLRAAVGKPAGELGAYKPTSEADRLRQDQRDALDQLIKTIVREGEARADRAPSTSKPDSGPGKPGLSVVPDNVDDAVAALDKKVSTVGEQGEPEDA